MNKSKNKQRSEVTKEKKQCSIWRDYKNKINKENNVNKAGRNGEGGTM